MDSIPGEPINKNKYCCCPSIPLLGWRSSNSHSKEEVRRLEGLL